MNPYDAIKDHANYVRRVDKANTTIKLEQPGVRSYEGTVNPFQDYTNEEILTFLEEKHYLTPRQLSDGSWCAIFPLFRTWAVCTDITKNNPYAYRWCFEIEEDAKMFLAELECFDDVPKNTSSLRGHRYHDLPRMLAFDHLGFHRW